MYKGILAKEQSNIFSLLREFSRSFGLVGGTAIALQLGHRKSVDFDLASLEKINSFAIRKKLLKIGKIEAVILDNENEYSVVAGGVKFTFFFYPFPVKFSQKVNSSIFMSDLLTLAAMKAYALGRRAKWKDYVDLYFIAKKYGSITPIIKKAKSIFKREFNEKIFRAQLAYFKDIDYSEKVIFAEGFEINEEKIKKELIKLSLE